MLCRLCGEKSDTKETLDVLEQKGLSKKIKTVLHIHIKPKDDFQKICLPCSQTVENFHSYYEEVQKTQLDLKGRKPKEPLDTKIFLPISCKVEIDEEETSEETFSATLKVKEEPDSEDEDEESMVDESNLDVVLKEDDADEELNEKDEKPTAENDPKRAEYKEMSEKINKFFDFMCKKCNLDLGNPFGYQLHMKRKHKRPNATINCCNTEIPSVRKELLFHYYTHTNIDKISCRFCGKQCSSMTYLRKHEQNHIEKMSKSAQVPCPDCGKVMINERSLKQHFKNFHSKIERPQYVCDICQKISHTKSTLVTHFLKIHKMGRNPVRKPAEEPVLCPVCAKSFQTDAGFKCHFKATHDIEKVMCPECGQEVNKITLKNHMRRLHDLQRATCDICLKEFRNIHTVLQHKNRVHIDPRHACDLCDKRFKTKDKLKDHRRGHFVENRFHCDLCTVTCNDYSNMLKHRKQVHQAPPIPKGMGRKVLEIGYQT